MTYLPTVSNHGPCGSCPYRRDVPAGIWDASEYDKLPGYDGPTWAQSPAVFLCHQQSGELCAGWAACHDTDHLLALRISPVAPEVYGYQSPVPVFASGAEARAHGLSGVAAPDQRAVRVVKGLLKKRDRRSEDLTPTDALTTGAGAKP